MSPVAEGLSWATAVLLGIIAGLAIRDWYRDRDPARAALAVALGLIAFVSIGGRVNVVIGPQRVLSDVSVVAFALSGFALLEYRSRIKALPAPVRVAAAGATLAAAAFVLWVRVPPGSEVDQAPLERFAVLLFVAVWTLCVLPSAVGFFRIARHRPPVEAARLRLLGAGYGGIVAVIFAAVGGGQGLSGEPTTSIIRTITLLLVAVLFSAVEPPMWLRRRWLQGASERLARDAVPGGAWYWDEPSGLVVGSEGFYDLFGVPPSEMGTRRESFLERIHPDDRGRMQEAIELGDRAPPRMDYRVMRPDGEVRWIHGRSEVVRDPTTGKMAGAFGLAQDVTDRKETEAAQGWLAAIIQSSTDAIVGKTVGGTITSWNPAATQLFGWKSEEAVGRSREVLIPPEHRAQEKELLRRVSEGVKIDPYEAERLTKDGSKVLVAVSPSPIRNQEGEIIGVSTIYRDMTDLRRAEAKFEGLMEAAPDAMVLVDTRGLIHMVNAQAVKLFGYERSELVGRPLEILVPERAKRIHPSHRAGYFASPATRPMGAGLELTARRKDGTEFPVDIALSSLETEEGVIVSAAIRDISDRIRALEEKKELESMIRQTRLESVGQLAGGIAHDFNNLLAGITIYSKLVETRIRKGLKSPESREELQAILEDIAQIERARERASTLIQQLLVFSRKEVVKPQILDLNDVVSELENLLRRTIGEHILLTTKLSASLPLIEVDPGHVEQVLMNLVVNARDAMSSGGTLLVETTPVTFNDSTTGSVGIGPGEYVCLTVSDTGTGMSKEVVAKAFEPFFTTKPKGEGSGLGLAMVYGIATQSGGRVSLYSEPDVGTTVKVYFPATAASSVPEKEARPAIPEPATGEMILLVEDEDLVREPVARFLVEHGYRVLSAATPEDALQLSDQHHDDIQLLLTDVIMPGMTGKDLAERLLRSRPNMPVVFMSGYSQDVIVHQGAVEPGVVLIEKPFTVQELLQVVREVLSAARS